MICNLRACGVILMVVLVGIGAVEAQSTPTQLDTIVAVGTRTPRPQTLSAAAITVVDDEQISSLQIRNLDDLMRYEVGLSAESAGVRFGVTGLNIRGIGANRTAIELDGAPIGDQFTVGSFASAGRGLIEPEFIERVEILRGPASALYGSDAIGGISSFKTVTPQALVTGAAPFEIHARSGYDTLNDGRTVALLGGWLGESSGLAGGVVSRMGHARDHAADSDAEDTLDTEQFGGFGRYDVDLTPEDRFSVIVSADSEERVSVLRSVLGYGQFANTSALAGADRQVRRRFVAEYAWSRPLLLVDGGALRGVYQHGETTQLTDEEQLLAGVRREFEFDYVQTALGLELELLNRFYIGDARHRLGFGMDVLETRTAERRDGIQVRLDGTGSATTVQGVQYPLRDFPRSRTREAALWVQDEIDWLRLTWIPALRAEWYSLTPRLDPLYQGGIGGAEAVSIREQQLTPRLGLLWDFAGRWILFGQYSRGFRAPPFEDVNIGLDIPQQNLRAIPNPDLEAETSDTLEMGVRWRRVHTRAELAGFYSRYTNFIESRVNVGVDPATGVQQLQAQDLEQAEISGVELRIDQDLAILYQSLLLKVSGFWARGRDTRTGEVLDTVDPPHAVVGLEWNPNQLWGVSLYGRFVSGKNPADRFRQYATDGYAVADLHLNWRPTRKWHVRVGLLNLFDRTAWQWQDVRGVAPDDPVLPHLSLPGRNLGISVSTRYD